MAVDRLKRLLARYRLAAIDTSVFIYQLERNPRYLALADQVFLWLEGTEHQAVTSTITMTELLVPAYREEDESTVDLFYGLLVTYPNLKWVAPDLETADLAARLRANYRLRTPDALQAACAIQAGATAFVTNDPSFRQVKEFDAVVFDDFL